VSNFSRIVYDDDRILEQGRAFAERAYGARVHVVSTRGEAPAQPHALTGTLLHLDPLDDPAWARGESNPMLDYLALKEKLGSLYGVGDIDDKWHEYRFLKRASPAIAPPRMELAETFAVQPISEEERRRAQAVVRRALAGRPRGESARADDLVRLEVVRARIHAAMGRAFLKVRDLNHSEGKLPCTDGDWVDLYVCYVSETKRAIERLEGEVAGTCATLESRITDLPHVSGRVLDLLLHNPVRVVAQAFAHIGREVRLHVVEGSVLGGATFLRFYPLGSYLSEAEATRVELAIESELLARLPPAIRRFSFSPDVMIEEGTGAVRVLDLNAGIESGYYYPEEDVLTTNLLAERFTGALTPVLVDFGHAMAQSGARRARAVQRMAKKLAPLFAGDVHESFWDRVLVHLVRDVAREPGAPALDAALEELVSAGVPRASIAHQLIAAVQDAHPDIVLSRECARRWVGRLNELEPAVATYVSDGRLYATRAEPRHRPRREAAGVPRLVPLPAR
jgi:hypothetical protein